MADEPKEESQTSAGRRKFEGTTQVALAVTGALMIVTSYLALVVIVLTLRKGAAPESTLTVPPDLSTNAAVVWMVSHYLDSYMPVVLLMFAAVIAAAIGYGLLRAAGAADRQVIPKQDYELIRELLLAGNQGGIDQYIRLSSLSGIVGNFTKVGLSGLPLATIALTVMFTVLALTGADKFGDKFFDLAKLTLGAFIGSYVQRSVSERAASGEVVGHGSVASNAGRGSDRLDDPGKTKDS